ncbi:MAG: response regulator [Candidatus Manganitrophaceae bacterium]
MEKHCILIVDDEPNIRSSLARLLYREGYETLLSESAEEGLILLKKRTISTVISDYSMSGQTGIQFLTTVRDLYPNPVRIILSGRLNMKEAMRAVDIGLVSHLLMKPWDNETLKKTIRKAVDKFEREGLESSHADSPKRSPIPRHRLE